MLPSDLLSEIDDPACSAVAAACPGCGGPIDLRSPHVVVDGRAIRSYCSASCRSLSPSGAITLPARRRGRGTWARLVRVSLGVPMLGLMSGHDATPKSDALAPIATLPSLARPAPPPEPIEGPAWPPTESDWVREIAADAWLHPLDGPTRRMPVSDSRVFGAERPGDRPGECESGHCGVDLSGPWGEPVHAAHSGVVDRVQRGANEDHGGQYVRIAHRDGTIFTQYFHLAAIPRRLSPGVPVRVGEVIGLLGDTGVKHSDAHLHFTISVRPGPTVPEKYIDPEPLIALWPLRIAIEDSAGMITSQAAPGVPRGANHHRKKTPPREESKKSAMAEPTTAEQ
jgi:hypothetical protein